MILNVQTFILHLCDFRIYVSVSTMTTARTVQRFPKNNQLDALISKIYFFIKPYMFRASFVPIIRGYPLYTRQVGTPFQPDSARKRSHNLHKAYQLPCVQWITPDDGHKSCPKHIGFYEKINFIY